MGRFSTDLASSTRGHINRRHWHWPAGARPLDPSWGCVDRLRFCCRRFPPAERGERMRTSLTLKNATMKGCFSQAPSRPTNPASLGLILRPGAKAHGAHEPSAAIWDRWDSKQIEMHLTTAGLYADLQAQVVPRAHHPQVARGGDVELQPAFIGRPQSSSVQQEQVCLPAGTLCSID